MLAVEGKNISGVTVAHISKSISFGLVLVFFSKPFTHSVPITEVPFPSPFKILLSLIPVLVVIHSSEVSTSFSSSAFDKIYKYSTCYMPAIQK